jgi:hypothetical protein
MAADSPCCLLMPSCAVADAPFTALRQTDQRVALTLEALAHWRRIDADLPIVLCDGSGFDFGPLVAGRFGPGPIEVLRFRNDAERVAAQGKGYGEGQIVAHALGHSQQLSRTAFFGKCTAKLWVDNFPQLLREWNGRFKANVGMGKPTVSNRSPIRYVDTRFYLASTRFYQAHLMRSHETTCDADGRFLEHAFLDSLRASGENLPELVFAQLPQIRGTSGSDGQRYAATPASFAHLRHRMKHWVTRFDRVLA